MVLRGFHQPLPFLWLRCFSGLWIYVQLKAGQGAHCLKADWIKGEAGTSLEAVKLNFSLCDERERVPRGSNSQAALSFDRSKKAVLNLEQLPTQYLIPWQSWLPPSSHTSYYFLEYCSRMLIRFCFHTRKDLWLGRDDHDFLYQHQSPLLWTKHLPRRGLPGDGWFFTLCSNRTVNLLEVHDVPHTFWSQAHGKHTKFAFTTRWRSPKGRLMVSCQPASCELTWRQNNKPMAPAFHMCVEILLSGMWNDEKEPNKLELIWMPTQQVPRKSNRIIEEVWEH